MVDSSSVPQEIRSALGDVAPTLRHIIGKEEYDDDDVRTIWHQGHAASELLSWQHRDGHLVQQELVFLGEMIEYREGKGFRTGSVPIGVSSSHAGMGKSVVVQLQSPPDPEILCQAVCFLESVERSDEYTDALLEALRGFNP